MFAAHLHTRSLAFLIGCIAVYGQTMPSSASGASQRPAPPEFSVAGVVHDPSGALIQGAFVALKGRGAPEQSAATDAQGNFGFAGLPAGAYEIRVDYTGFKPYRARVTIRERSPAPRRIFLEIADLRDEITVDTGEARVNTDVDSNLDVVRLDTQTLENLPILGQDVIGALSQVLDPASLRADMVAWLEAMAAPGAPS